MRNALFLLQLFFQPSPKHLRQDLVAHRHQRYSSILFYLNALPFFNQRNHQPCPSVLWPPFSSSHFIADFPYLLSHPFFSILHCLNHHTIISCCLVSLHPCYGQRETVNISIGRSAIRLVAPLLPNSGSNVH